MFGAFLTDGDRAGRSVGVQWATERFTSQLPRTRSTLFSSAFPRRQGTTSCPRISAENARLEARTHAKSSTRLSKKKSGVPLRHPALFLGQSFYDLPASFTASRASFSNSLASPSFSSAWPEICFSTPLSSCDGLPMIFPTVSCTLPSRSLAHALGLVFVHDGVL